jgi:hypothetical protein
MSLFSAWLKERPFLNEPVLGQSIPRNDCLLLYMHINQCTFDVLNKFHLKV